MEKPKVSDHSAKKNGQVQDQNNERNENEIRTGIRLILYS